MRGATMQETCVEFIKGISIHAPHAGRDELIVERQNSRIISIHAPHAGRDRQPDHKLFPALGISIHAPHAGRDGKYRLISGHSRIFQSTRPMRGATVQRKHFACANYISIHAPHAGRDNTMPYKGTDAEKISIHAPHAGRDCLPYPSPFRCVDFNPRAPCGARRRCACRANRATRFQSTRPMRGATSAGGCEHGEHDISIHAPHAGRDESRRFRYVRDRHFNPRAPCGARQRIPLESLPCTNISIHAPHAGRDQKRRQKPGKKKLISIHAPHAGRDGRAKWYTIPKSVFQSTRPMRGATKLILQVLKRCFHFNPRAPCGARLRRGDGLASI